MASHSFTDYDIEQKTYPRLDDSLHRRFGEVNWASPWSMRSTTSDRRVACNPHRTEVEPDAIPSLVDYRRRCCFGLYPRGPFLRNLTHRHY